MEQPAADEFLRGNPHDFCAMAIRGVFPAKGYAVIFNRHQPRSGDGDPMGITPQIAKDLDRPAEWPLGVDDPVLAPADRGGGHSLRDPAAGPTHEFAWGYARECVL